MNLNEVSHQVEIRINGRVLKDPAYREPRASFPGLMADLNRLISLREEVITDVRADGREIAAWDSAEIDLSALFRLDIQSRPAREYAVDSLGDVGEYAGEILSVLRNVETISRKDGFDVVRAKLTDGLDYIQTVIETSASILKFNLAECRYDLRSGEQMLKELRSLKTRVAEAPDFESAKKSMEDLEFSLTDWLKFLESLLHKYGEKQAEMGSAEDIVIAARSQITALDRLNVDLKAVVEDLYAGKVAKSLDQLQTRITALQDSLVYLQRLRQSGRVRYQTLSVNDESLNERIPQIAKILKELSDSIQVGDTVLMRDLIEYEILPFIAFVRQIYSQICTSDDSSSLS